MPHVVTDGDSESISHLLDTWEILYDPELNFDTKLTRLFERETEEFDLSYGFLTRIDRRIKTQTIETAHGSHSHLQDGETAPLSESYCRKTIREPDGVFHLNDARKEGWTDDPAYQRFQFGTYIGATVASEESFYGTLCFASSEPRGRALTDSERRLVKLLAMWVRDVCKTQFRCDCGTTLSVPTDPNGEVLTTVSCQNCGCEYAVTISQIN